MKRITIPVLVTIAVISLFVCRGYAANPLKTPERILSLTPAGTEIIYFLGLGDRVIAATKYCNWPPEVQSKQSIGDMMNINLEVLSGMSPDLVLLSNMNEHLDARVKALGYDTVIVYQDDLEQICESIIDVGGVCGVEDSARDKAADLRKSVETLSASARSGDNGNPPRVLVVVGRDPAGDDLRKIYVAGVKSFYDELIRESGAVNALEQDAPYAQISQEGLLRIDPDVIIDLIGEHGGADKPADEIISQWQSIPYLRAPKEGRVSVIKGDFTLRAGPRYPLILEAFIRVIRDGEREILEQEARQ